MLLTRRRLLVTAPAVPFAVRAFAQPVVPHWVFFGTDKGEGVYRAAWNAATGEIGKPVLAAAAPRPTFLAWHPTLPVMYSANASSGDRASTGAFAADPASGTLTLLNTSQTHSDGPCYVAVDRSGHAAYTANYGGGSLTAFRLAKDGRLAETVGVLRYNQPEHGPVADRQDAAHLHCAVLSPDNRFVVTCDLGDDVLLVFPVAPEQGASIQTPLRFATAPGAGPRHVAFHPNGRFLYCINELDCTVTLFDWRVRDGQPSVTPRPDATVPLLPGGKGPDDTGCEIVLSPDGRFCYTCTRGADILVTYRIDAATGMLTEQQRLACGGHIPRLIAFDPSRRWLLCMNQGSSDVTVFRHEPGTGRLQTTPRVFPAETPMCAVWP